MSTIINTSRAAERGAIDSGSRLSFLPTVYLAFVQGVYFFLTGIWPLLSIDTFQMVTGPKMDLWLVQTVGVLITVIAVVLLVAAWRRRTTAEVVLLALASAMALGAVDVVFVVRQVIAPIYLLDAAAEAVLVMLWLLSLAMEMRNGWRRSDL